MDTAFSGHLVLEQRVDQAVAGGLHLGAKCLGGDDYPEMSLSRGATFHGLVVGVKVGIVVNLEGGGLESNGDLLPDHILDGSV